MVRGEGGVDRDDVQMICLGYDREDIWRWRLR